MRRFPVGLTVTALIAFAILIGLGAWQVRRLAWKQGVLAKIGALKYAAPTPISTLTGKMAGGEDVSFVRVRVVCRPPVGFVRPIYRYAVHDGRVAWRAISPCLFVDPAYDGIMVDRGIVERLTGSMVPTGAAGAGPAAVSGVLRVVGGKPVFDSDAIASSGDVLTVRIVDRDALLKMADTVGLRRPAPYLLAAESETPAPTGISPAALPSDIPNNHLVYALTWFALAGILAWFYGALVWRRMMTT